MNCWLVGIPTLGAGLQEAMKSFHSKHFVHTTIFEWWIVLNLHRDVFFRKFSGTSRLCAQMDGRFWKHDIYPDPRSKRPGHQDEQTNPVHFPLTEEQAVVVVPFCHGWLWMQANRAHRFTIIYPQVSNIQTRKLQMKVWETFWKIFTSWKTSIIW